MFVQWLRKCFVLKQCLRFAKNHLYILPSWMLKVSLIRETKSQRDGEFWTKSYSSLNCEGEI